MKRFATSILALGLVAGVGAASAQSSYSSSGYNGYQTDDRYDDGVDYDRDGDTGGYRGYPSQPTVDRYGNSVGAQYDDARVVRVDPVITSGNGYGGYGNNYASNASSQQRCYTRQDGVYAGSGGYDNNGSYNDGRNEGYDDRVYRSGGSDGGRSVATVLGAALGSRVGGGSARYATAALGTVVGGIAGREIYDSNNRYATSRTGSVTVCDPVPVSSGYRDDDARVAGYDVTYEYADRRYTTRTDFHPGDRIRVRVDVRAE
ncbi:MAG: glycine zipper 2TM domain-containing protein [Luteimonas sp.]